MEVVQGSCADSNGVLIVPVRVRSGPLVVCIAVRMSAEENILAIQRRESVDLFRDDARAVICISCTIIIQSSLVCASKLMLHNRRWTRTHEPRHNRLAVHTVVVIQTHLSIRWSLNIKHCARMLVLLANPNTRVCARDRIPNVVHLPPTVFACTCPKP